MSNKYFPLWLSINAPAGSSCAKKLYEYFSSDAEKIYNASYDDYIKAGISKKTAEKLTSKDLSLAEKLYAYCESENIITIEYPSPDYPANFKLLNDPPAVLYCKGDISLLKSKCISMVGTRNCSEQALAEAFEYAYNASSHTIVTGLASGIDSACAKGALCGNGKVIGILGCGVDTVYPKENAKLFSDVEENGLLLSEFAPASNFFKTNFIKRNRLISALSYATVIFESNPDGGAMHTAKFANEQRKRLYVHPNSKCRDDILLLGGEVLYSVTDISDDLKDSKRCSLSREEIAKIINENSSLAKKQLPKKSRVSLFSSESKNESVKEKDLSMLSETEKEVYSRFTREEMYTDELKSDKYSTNELLASLTMLEIYGLISALPGGKFKKL